MGRDELLGFVTSRLQRETVKYSTIRVRACEFSCAVRVCGCVGVVVLVEFFFVPFPGLLLRSHVTILTFNTSMHVEARGRA